MALLTRDQILSAAKLRSERVAVPEWGGDVILRELTGEERDAYETEMVSTDGTVIKVDKTNLRAKLVAKCIVDEKNNRLFTDADVVALGKTSAAALSRCFEVVRRLSGMDEEAIEELGKD